MMAFTIKQTEAMPASYPDLGSPSPLSAAAAALDAAMLWQRLEGYCAHRWSEREVVWVVEGCGDWLPPLVPATISTIELWSDGEWAETFDVSPSPCGGLIFPSGGPYRVTATVGADNDPPENVLEAFRRLAEYAAAKPGKAGASREQKDIGGVLTVGYSRDPNWLAMALQHSGAADLLRPYRRAT